jgi:hypothetical protein
MKAGTGGVFQAPLVEERSRELLHGQIQQQLEFTLHRILDSVSLARLVGEDPATSAGARVRWFCDNLVTGGANMETPTHIL